MMLRLPLLCLCGLLIFAAHPAAAAVIDVQPGSAVPSLADVAWQKLQPGDQVIVHDGTYDSDTPVVISVKGTEQSPITIMAAKGAKPILKSTLVFEDAAFVTAQGLTITECAYSGFIIRRRAHDITLSGNIIHHAPLGIWIGDEAGSHHLIIGNVIYGNKTHGIAVDFIADAIGHETVIRDNEVYQNGAHGIELSGSYYIVDHNIFHENGTKMPGTSNIHLFGGPMEAPKEPRVCQYNKITRNITYGEHDNEQFDGNGIQADSWCDHNEITHNVSFGNDGGGITIYMASDNIVTDNTVFDNVKDPGKTHPLRGEIIVASNPDVPTGQSLRNIIKNNIAVATKADIYAVFGYQTEKPLLDGVTDNILFNQADAAKVIYLQNAEHALPVSIGNNKVAKVSFVNATQPLQGGLRVQPNTLPQGSYGAYIGNGNWFMP